MSDSSSTASMSSVNVDEEYDDEWNESETKTREITASQIIAYTSGGILLLLSYLTFSSNPAAAPFFGLAGLFAIPVVRRGIKEVTGIEFSRWSVVLICVVIYGIGAVIFSVVPSA